MRSPESIAADLAVAERAHAECLKRMAAAIGHAEDESVEPRNRLQGVVARLRSPSDRYPEIPPSRWVWWLRLGGYAVGPKDKGAVAIVFTEEEALALCAAVNAARDPDESLIALIERLLSDGQDLHADCCTLTTDQIIHSHNPDHQIGECDCAVAEARAAVRAYHHRRAGVPNGKR